MTPETKMTMDDILVTPENHARLDPEHDTAFGITLNNDEWDRAMKAHTSLNSYFDSAFGDNRVDWGASYNKFLSALGIEPNSDNGWWSKAAVHRDNIRAFVEDMTDNTDDPNGMTARLDRVRAAVSAARKLGVFHATKTATEMAALFDHEPVA